MMAKVALAVSVAKVEGRMHGQLVRLPSIWRSKAFEGSVPEGNAGGLEGGDGVAFAMLRFLVWGGVHATIWSNLGGFRKLFERLRAAFRSLQLVCRRASRVIANRNLPAASARHSARSSEALQGRIRATRKQACWTHTGQTAGSNNDSAATSCARSAAPD